MPKFKNEQESAVLKEEKKLFADDFRNHPPVKAVTRNLSPLAIKEFRNKFNLTLKNKGTKPECQKNLDALGKFLLDNGVSAKKVNELYSFLKKFGFVSADINDKLITDGKTKEAKRFRDGIQSGKINPKNLSKYVQENLPAYIKFFENSVKNYSTYSVPKFLQQGALDKSLKQQQQSEFIAAIGLANMMDKLMDMNKEQKKLLEKMQEEMEKRKKAA